MLYVPGTFSAGILLLGMWMFVAAHPGFWLYGIFVLLSSLYLGLSYFIGLFGRDFDFDKHRYRNQVFKHQSASVDIYLPCCGEPIEVLRNTYRYVKRLRWPTSQLRVYVLDDKNDLKVKWLAEEFAYFYIARPNSGELKKAGNMRYAFARTKGEFIAVFDADFCPHPEFLHELLPYMADDVAIVQSPQFFSVRAEQTWVEKGAGYIQELFYRLIQVSRDRFAAAICVGSNAIYRRSALEPFGGTAAIAYSEDVHTGFMVTDAGWRVKYVPVCLARGICPSSLDGFFVQQYRWATGSLSLFLNQEFWRSRLTAMQKLCYLSGMLYYLCTGLGTVLTVAPSLVLVWWYPELVLAFNVAFSLPSFLYGTVALPLWTRQPWGWYAQRARLVAAYANLFALIDKLRGSLVPWQVSGAGGRVKRFEHFRHFMFWWIFGSTILVVLGIGFQSERFEEFIPMLFFSCFNAWLHLSVLRDQ